MANLFLDTAYFPGVQQAIDAAHAVNADGWAGYIFDPYLPNGNGGWTPDAVKALLGAGLGFLPIYVPGNSPITGQRTIEVLQAYGFNNGPCVIDIEGGSDPGQTYVEQWCDTLKAAGYMPIVYGTESTVAQDANHASGIWIANYQYKSVQPQLGPFPPGFNQDWFANARAWQYANSFSVAGVDVDASTSNLPLDHIASQGGGGTVTVLGPFNPPVAGKLFNPTTTTYDWNTLAQAGSDPSINITYTWAKNVNGTWYDKIDGSDWCVSDADVDTGGTNPQQEWDKRQAAPQPQPQPNPQPQPQPQPQPEPEPTVDLAPVMDKLTEIDGKLDSILKKLNAAGSALIA